MAGGTKIGLAVLAAVIAFAGIGYAYLVYIKKRTRAVEPEFFARGWYFDESISAFADKPGRKAFQLTADFDAGIVDGVVNGAGALVTMVGRQVRKVQSGYVRGYTAAIGGGAAIVLIYFLNRVAL